jgi:methionyl-tRNA synthetase
MSKSRGTGLSPLRYLDLGMNPEWLRYYLAAKLNARMEDVDFNAEDFVLRVNSDLVGKFVNIASRTSGFVVKRFEGRLAGIDARAGADFAAGWAGADAIANLYEQREFGKAMREIMAFADRINQYVDAEKPWDLARKPEESERLHRVCSNALRAFRDLAILLSPVLPETATRVGSFLEVDLGDWAALDVPLPEGHRIGTYKHLLQRVDPKVMDALFGLEAGAQTAVSAAARSASVPTAGAPAPAAPAKGAQPTIAAAAPASPAVDASPSISVDDFARIELRVARIVSAERVDGSRKLLRLMLDLGPLGERQVFSGVAAHLDPAKITGRLTLVVANLAPRKMKFGVSEGMMLVAGDDDGLHFIGPDSGATPGMRVS